MERGLSQERRGGGGGGRGGGGLHSGWSGNGAEEDGDGIRDQ